MCQNITLLNPERIRFGKQRDRRARNTHHSRDHRTGSTAGTRRRRDKSFVAHARLHDMMNVKLPE